VDTLQEIAKLPDKAAQPGQIGDTVIHIDVEPKQEQGAKEGQRNDHDALCGQRDRCFAQEAREIHCQQHRAEYRSEWDTRCQVTGAHEERQPGVKPTALHGRQAQIEHLFAPVGTPSSTPA